MSSSPVGFVFLLAAVAAESCAQLFLKRGATSARRWIVAGIATYLIEILLYTVALRFLEVSVAFALGSLSFVGVALLSKVLLRETVGRARALGIAFILAGTMLVAW